MSSSKKRGVTQNPEQDNQGPRKSARINKEQPGDQVRRPGGRQARRSISSKDTKMPKIVKSVSPTEKQKLDILHSHKKMILWSSKVMMIVIVIEVNRHLKYQFGDLQTYHQELRTFLKLWAYIISLSH